MSGKRRDLIRRDDGNYDCLKPGEYGKDEDGLWHCCAPAPVDADGFGIRTSKPCAESRSTIYP